MGIYHLTYATDPIVRALWGCRIVAVVRPRRAWYIFYLVNCNPDLIFQAKQNKIFFHLASKRGVRGEFCEPIYFFRSFTNLIVPYPIIKAPTIIFNICITIVGIVPLRSENIKTELPINIRVANPVPRPNKYNSFFV